MLSLQKNYPLYPNMEVDLVTRLMHFSQGAYFILSIVLCCLQWAKDKENALQRWLAWLFTMLMMINILSFILFFVWAPFEDNIYETDFLQMTAIYPCVLLLNEAAHPNTMKWSKVVWGFLPYVVMWMLFRFGGYTLLYNIAGYASVVVAVVGICYTIYSMAMYHQMLRDNYSSIEMKDLRWLGGILMAFSGLLLLWVIACFFTSGMVAMTYNLLSCAIWSALYFFCNRQKVIVFFEKDNSQDIAEVTSSIEEKDSDCNSNHHESVEPQYHFAVRFIQLMERERYYLNPDLSLADLAAELNTNRTYLSRYINNAMHCTFYDYVNNLRIAYARKLLVETDDKIDVVAMLSGFNSITTFRRMFSKTYGMTASEYRKKEHNG